MKRKKVYVYGARSETFLSGTPYYLARALEKFGRKNNNSFDVVDLAPRRTSEVPLTYLRWCVESITTRTALFRLSKRYHDRSGRGLRVAEDTRPYFVVCSQNIPASIMACRRSRPDSRIIIYIDATLNDLFETFDYAFSPPPALAQRMLRDEKIGYEMTDLIVVFHDGIRDRLISDYGVPPEKIQTIGRGINFDFDYATQVKVSKRSAVDHKLHLMVVGRGAKRKGVFKLIEAIDTLTPEEQGRLVLTVAGPEKKEIPSRPYLKCLGFISAENRDSLTREMKAQDLGVLLSDADSLPGSVWEFLALGAPVWVSDLPSISEALKDYPAIIEDLPLKTASLAERLRGFIHHPEILADLLQNNTKSTRELTWDVQAKLIGEHVVDDQGCSADHSVRIAARVGAEALPQNDTA